MRNTRNVTIIVDKWLWPLQRVVVPITKVRTEKKLSIASQRRIEDRFAVGAGDYKFPIVNDGTDKTV
jgi:hypothetical protein